MLEIIDETKRCKYIEKIKEVLTYAFEYMKVKNSFVSVVIVDNKQIHKINKEYRNIDKTTDVISFAFLDTPSIYPKELKVLGEIYINVDSICKESKEYLCTEERMICHLAVHGLLHLLGFNHENDNDEKIMKGYEEKILYGSNL